MSSEVLKDAARVPAPVSSDGDVIVLATVATARAAQEVVTAGSRNTVWYRFHADGLPLYLTFGDSSVAAPDSTAVSGSGRAVKIEAGQKEDFEFDGHTRTHFRDISTGTTGYLRACKVSHGNPSR